MSEERKTLVINEIGLFAYGKGNWLEYSNKMDLCFEKYHVIFDERKKEICTAAIGARTLKILKALIRPNNLQDPDVTYEIITETLEAYFYPNPDSSFYITKFTLRKQKKYESFFKYVVALRKLLVNCKFARKGQHSKLRNQLISGACDELKEKFNANSMSLSQVFETGLLWDDSKIIKPPPRPRNHKARKNRIPKCFRCSAPVIKHKGLPCVFEWAVCSCCGIKGHVSLACKYKDISCNNCQGKGHIAKLCKKEPLLTSICTHNVIIPQ